MLIAVVFATGYQSIHTFSHEHHKESLCCDAQHEVQKKTTNQPFITENENCPVCDFDFVVFIPAEFFSFSPFLPTAEFSVCFVPTQKEFSNETVIIYLRGPPFFV